MHQKLTIPFEISSMDSLGQGVSKVTDKVTFIPKTVVGDKGEAWIMSEKKGVAFARLKHLDHPSDKRIEPLCLHFQTCPSCHYLQVDYSYELEIKKTNFEKLFRKLPLPEIEVIGAMKRTGYRNRIQLHYSLKSKLLGMRDPQNFSILAIPDCLIGVPEIISEVKRLYENNNWIKEIPDTAPTDGHVEIYWNNNLLKVSWNRPYAEGGFTQVYSAMNEKLKITLAQTWQLHHGDILDLFGGNGNLSEGLNYSKRLCVDQYQQLPGSDFFSLDIYSAKAISTLAQEIKNRKLVIKNLLLDPPRSGLKNLNDWIELLKPQTMAYVSCDPHTMVRDLQSIQGYKYKKAFLIDFFPSTFHFESLIILERNN